MMELIEQFKKESETQEPLSNGFLKTVYHQKYIKWLESKVKNNVDLADVSNQRELLIAFNDNLNVVNKGLKIDVSKKIDNFLSNL